MDLLIDIYYVKYMLLGFLFVDWYEGYVNLGEKELVEVCGVLVVWFWLS